jgi:hypothetical protein
MDTQEKYTCWAEELLAGFEAELERSEAAGDRFDEALARLRDRGGLTQPQQEALHGLAKRVRKCRKRSRKVRRKTRRLRARMGVSGGH